MQQSADERFQRIYEHHLATVTAYVRRRAPADVVEDVVADTFLICWRRLSDVPRDPLPWLYTVARNTIANERRATARRAATSLPGDAPGEPDIASDPVLARALARLSDDDREILRLVAWEHLSLRLAATTLGCTYVACRVRFHRARRRLAAHLGDIEDTERAASPTPHPKGATQ